jgi:predicted GNAT family acetyltransferase
MEGSRHMDEVRDDRENNRYEVTVDGYLAELDYQIRGDQLWVVHTAVPRAIEGRGVAGRLMEVVVAQAKSAGLAIVPQCSYARYWLDKHRSELEDLDVTG